ncbi:lamin tail domain-containing protein, partial [bacterium]|nr:lamin tail domain-containing protein [bacterium]
MTRFIKILLITLLLTLSMPGFNPLDHTRVPTTGAKAEVGGDFLLLNEISPFGSDDKTWIEIINPTSDPVLLDGWTIELYSGFSYTFPDNSTEIPGDGLHVLEINGNPFNPQGDGCTLISPDGPADAISWGYPPAPPATTIPSGLPLHPDADFLPDASKPFNPDDVCIRVPSSLAYEIQNPVGSIHWVIRDGNQSTSGEPNPPPGPWVMLPV